MYEELVGDLRYCDKGDCNGCRRYTKDTRFCDSLLREAADAIEELQQTVKHYKGCSDDWYKEACDYKAICEQMKATIIVEAQHTEMFDERDKKTLMEMVKSLPLQIIPHKDEKPRWIPVTERLPEPKFAREWYLVALESGCVKSLAYEKEGRTDNLFRPGWHETASPVTHWMPLPEPPKEES